MTPATIRYSKWMRIQGVLVVLLLTGGIIFFVWIFSNLAGWLPFPSPFEFLGLVIFVVPLLVGLAFFAMIVVWAVRAANYLSFRLEFLDASFRMQSFSWAGRKISVYAYRDVRQVSRGQLRGTVEMKLNGSEPIRLTPLQFEGNGDAFFSQLEHHIPSDRMEPDLKASVRKFNRYDFLIYPIVVGILAGVLITSGQSVGLDVLRSQAAWKDAIPYSLQTSYRAVSTEEDGTVWFAAYYLGSKGARAGRIRGGSTQTWDAPLSAFGAGGAYDILGVGGTADGNPVLITDKYLLSWIGGDWIRTTLPAEIFNFLGYSLSGHSLQYLSAKDNQYRFWSCDLTLRACSQLSVPDALKRTGPSPFLYRGSASGPVAAVGDPDGLVSFSQYREGTWNEIAQPLTVPSRALLALAVDGDGTLWVTRDLTVDSAWDGRYPKVPLAFGRWDAAAGQWRWSALDAFPESFEQEVENMEVDPRGRIWIAGHFHAHDVLIGETAGVYSIQGERAAEIIRYTDDNSNFQMGIGSCPMVQGPDGSLWSCDSGLVSLDAGAEFLPEPVPGWLAAWGGNTFRMLVLGIVCMLELAYFTILGILFLLRRTSSSAATGKS
jgi:hypothetical protein